MRRLSLWMRAHPMAGDGVITALLLVPELAVFLARASSGLSAFWYVTAGALLVGPLVFRRRWPVPAAYCVLLGYLIQVPTGGGVFDRPGDLSLAIFLYTLVAFVGRKAAAPYCAAVYVAWTATLLTNGVAPGLLVPALFFLLPQLAMCWALGEFAGARRAYHAEVEQRLRNLEFERDQQARIAVAEERNRIARELHDVLAHSVSVMITQADGAALALRGKPELAEQAVGTISTTGREALTELRSLLRVLRDEEGDGGRTPQPTAAGVRELVGRVRALGLPVTLDLDGNLEELPTGLGLAVYRIVQESLTNALKHAGWKAGAAVLVGNDGRQVEIEVTDSGARSALPPTTSGGNGIIGMRERATVYGGTLDAGPREEGGWRVHAVLPLSRQVSTGE